MIPDAQWVKKNRWWKYRIVYLHEADVGRQASVLDYLLHSGIFASKSEIRQRIRQGAVAINGETVPNEQERLQVPLDALVTMGGYWVRMIRVMKDEEPLLAAKGMLDIGPCIVASAPSWVGVKQ